MKFLSSLSIRGKLLFLIFIAVLPALGMILFSGLERRGNEIISTKRDLLHLVQSMAAQQEQVAAGTRSMLHTLAQLPEVQNIDAKACNRIFRNIHKQNPIYSTIAAATPDGNMFAASAPFTPGSVNLADRKHVRDAIRTRNFSAGEYIVGRVSRVPSINYTYPVLDENGKLIAVIIAGIKLDKYKEFMAQVNLPEGSAMGIADHKNLILYRFPEHRNIPPGTTIPLKYFQGMPAGSKEGFYEGSGLDNVSRIYAYKRLWLRHNEPSYMLIYVGVDKNFALHRANVDLVYNLVFLGVACLFAMLLAWIAGNSIIVEPLHKLVMATQQFGEGGLHVRADLPHREDELGRLAKSFDTMAAMLEMEDLERRKAEEALRASEEKHRLLIENSHDIIYTLTTDGVFTFVSPAWTVLLGHPVSQVEGQAFQPFVHPDDLAECMVFLQKAIGTGQRQEGVEYRVLHIDGSWRWHTSSAVPLKDEAGTIIGLEGTARDITAQKQLEEKLKSSEENFRTFFNTLDDMIIVGSPDGRIIYTNPAMTLKLGYSPAEFKNMHVLDVHPAAKRQEAEVIFAAMFKGEQEICPLPLAAKSGALIPVETRVWFGKWNGADCIFGISKDLTREQEALQKFTRLFNSNPALMAVSSLPERRFSDVNDAFLNALGYSRSEVIGKTSEEMDLSIQPEQQREMAEQLQAHGRVASRELKVKCKDGTIIDGLFSGEIIDNQGQKSFLTVMVDQTKRKQAEAERTKLEHQNRQLQKAESLGRMAGAIAHHFNNQLGAVIGNLELAMMELPQGEQPHAKITAAMEASSRAAEMSIMMLTYLGQSFAKCESLDLSEACRRTIPMLRVIMPGNVELVADLPSPGPIIMANVNQIQQVLANLTANAWEAVGEGRGAIHLRVKMVFAENITAVHRFPLDWQPLDNSYACLEVTDAGAGIADDDIEKIFDPFFTSKFTGRGMGLAVVLGIVRAHSGGVTVESELDRGSTFRVLFPISAEEVPLPPDKASQPALIVPTPELGNDSPFPSGVPTIPSPTIPVEKGGTVLLVEDDEMVRNVAAAMLNRLGFSVLEAKDGVEAVDVFRQRRDEIRCVLCDLTMPRMNGWETLTALRKLAPGIPVIMASGYDKAQVMAGDHPEWPQAFLGKPYDIKRLSDAINQALNKK